MAAAGTAHARKSPARKLAALLFCLIPQVGLACEANGEIDPETLKPDITTGTREESARYVAALDEQYARDEAFARANDAVVREGPWGRVRARDVAYIGIDECGNRVKLESIDDEWRFDPVLPVTLSDGATAQVTIPPPRNGRITIQRIPLDADGQPRQDMQPKPN